MADLCLARYKAENIEYTPTDESKKVPAHIGTSCHYALEKFVEGVYIDKTMPNDLETLLALYHQGYLETFDTVEYKTPEYEDGKEMVTNWFKRTDLTGVEVISVEEKRRFPVPTSIGDIPLTYIWDRCDIFYENGRKICRIVDYKSIRAALGHDDVRDRLQARIYDLMARTQFKDEGIDEFQVVFDLLRHDPVGVVYSREEAEDTWYAIIARAERIIATPDERPPETLNPECGYCVRKLQCKTLQRNIKGGGMFSVSTLQEAVEQRYEMFNQKKGIEAALEELDQIILTHAQQNDTLNFEEAGHKVRITASRRRAVDAALAAEIIGPELMKDYGKIGIGDVERIIKGGLVTDEQAEQLKATVKVNLSAPSVRITKDTPK